VTEITLAHEIAEFNLSGNLVLKVSCRLSISLIYHSKVNLRSGVTYFNI
jgi:hypothetical protein